MITLTRAEAQQVLDALEAEHSAIYGTSETARALETLRARLAEPEPEPVAMVTGYYGGWCVVVPTDPARVFNQGTAFYTAPPQREWQPLTDAELDTLGYECRGSNNFFEDYAKAIKAKLKEKNG